MSAEMSFFAWLNFISLCVACILMPLTYIISLRPAYREKSRGEKAWDECARWRLLSNIFEGVMAVNGILWLFVPIPELDWKVSPNILVGIVIGLSFGIPCLLIDIAALRVAGSETFSPSKNTKMFGTRGPYKYVRHPQIIGEIPLFIAGSFIINSLFLVLFFLAYLILYTKIILHFEEPDLVRRFGDAYIEYRKRTGAIFPKLRRKR